MIKHIVMIKHNDTSNESVKKNNLKKLKKDLEALPEKIEEIKYYEVGINITDSPRAFDMVLTSVFDDEKSLNNYSVHPEHKKVVDFIKSLAEKTIVVDYKV